jgi:phosphoribosylformimino-5-aminoimidazole carboxamide ribotide isomerase
MRVIPVIDLMDGQVVRGVAGRRAEYRPIQSVIAPDARPATVARALVERIGFETVYVADLDAILHGRLDLDSCKNIAATGLKSWLDAGLSNSAKAVDVTNRFKKCDVSPRLVVGLESLESQEALSEIQAGCRQAPIFSLDLKDGEPMTRIPAWERLSALEIALAAYSAGIRDLIVLDLADVGTNGGTRTLELCRQIRQAAAFDQIVAGGGVRGVSDLEALARAGCNAALVASALHDGRLTREEIRQVENLPH